MNRIIREKREIEKCKFCGQNYYLIKIVYPSNLDDKRTSYYCCPYCHQVITEIELRGNEDINTATIEK